MIILIPLIILPIILGSAGVRPGTLAVALVALALVILVFGTLTIVLTDRQLSLRFGVGLIRKTIHLGDVQSFSAVRNPWYWGWGIRFTPAGWLYNVSGPSAVDFLLHSGKHVQVGTDEPEALTRALRAVVGEPVSLSGDEQRADAAARHTRFTVIGVANLAIAAIVLGFVYVGRQPPAVNISPAMFSVHGGGFYRADIPMNDIVEVSLQDTIPRVVRKIGGFNAGGALRGRFRLEVIGNGQMFINRGIPPYLVLKTPDSFVIVNFTDPERTRALYGTLRTYVNAK